MFDIDTWAEGLTKEVFLEYQNEYSFWPHGFKVFYSPVRVSPTLMIISYQPGGTKEDFEEDNKHFFEKGDFSLPESNEYAESDYPMARSIREFFAFEGGSEILRQSVVFPLIFFRAPSIQIWKSLSREKRKEMEKFSLTKAEEIIKKIQSQKILVLGIATYERLKDILCPVQNERILHVRENSTERMMMSAECAGYQLFTIIHPSGARIKTEDRLKLRKFLQQMIVR